MSSPSPSPERRWVFLAHTLEPVGPPAFLLQFLRWLRDHEPIRPAMVSLAGGALADEFAALGEVTVVGDPGQASAGGPGGSIRALDPRTLRRLGRTAAEARLVYVNTAASIRAARFLSTGSVPIVSHVHELEVGLSYHLDADERHQFLDDSHALVAASRAVADNLVARHGVPRDRIAVHHEMIAIDDRPPIEAEAAIRRRLGIPGQAPIIGTAAVVNWRKGMDLFLQLALRIQRCRPDLDARFVWIGGRDDDPDTLRFRADIDAAHLGDRVHVIPFVDRPLDWMRTWAVFVLTAREDAFPLAGLEAASVGVPLVCFESGGLPELVEQDAGIVVPYPDLEAMGHAVCALVDDADRARRLGRRGATKVRERHDVEIAAPALLADLLRWERR